MLACPVADGTAKAELLINNRVAIVPVTGGRVKRFQANRRHRACYLARTAPATAHRIDFSIPTTGGHGRADFEATDSIHHGAAAAAAIADAGDVLAHIVGDLDKPVVLALLQGLNPLPLVDLACCPATNQGLGRVVESEANFLRRVTGMPQVLGLVATRAS